MHRIQDCIEYPKYSATKYRIWNTHYNTQYYNTLRKKSILDIPYISTILYRLCLNPRVNFPKMRNIFIKSAQKFVVISKREILTRY